MGAPPPRAKKEAGAAPESVAEVPAAPTPKDEAPVETVQAETAPAPPEPAKPEPLATVERPKPVITTLPPAPTIHKTEVKTLVKKSEPANAKAAPAPQPGDDGVSAAELRRTKSSPLVRKIEIGRASCRERV